METEKNIESIQIRVRHYCAKYGNATLLAAEVGVDDGVISRFIKGKTNPSGENIVKIEAALNRLDPPSAPARPSGVRVQILPGKRGRRPAPDPSMPVFNGDAHEYQPKEDAFPSEDTLTPEEYQVVLSIRASGVHPNAELQHLRTRIAATPLSHGQKHAIIGVIDKKYLDAAQTLLRMIKAK